MKYACIFHLILRRIPSCLVLSVNNGVEGRKGGTKQTKSVKTDGSYLSMIPNFLLEQSDIKAQIMTVQLPPVRDGQILNST